jgi:mRNA interferase HigB
MRVIAKKTLRSFWQKHPQAEQPLKSWWAEAKHAHWQSPEDIKEKYRHASILSDNRVIFNIAGNKYRLVVKIHYGKGIVFVRFIGTHAEYDRINAEVV